MNMATTIKIPLSYYYQFVSDCGEVRQDNDFSIAAILGRVLIRMSRVSGVVYPKLALRERLRLRAKGRGCVQMTVGQGCVRELAKKGLCDEKRVSAIACALVEEYLDLDLPDRLKLLKI